MPTDKSKNVRAFLKANVYNLEVSGGSGSIVNLPEYEIHPREFLEYAKAELENLKTNQSIINCVSNLKRAIDCQIDIFLYALNLLNIYKERRLGIDKKLGFIEKCGIFSKQSLSRINSIRNRLEHDYKIPKIEDIEVYLDLTEAFISVLEVQLLIGGHDNEVEFTIHEYPEDKEAQPIKIGQLISNYQPKEISHSYHWHINGSDHKYIADFNNLDELAAFIRYHILLLNISRTYHGQYASSQLEKL